jgi:hypothetical protein
MRSRRRGILVGAVALAGILLVALGIGGLRELLVIGKVPPELLDRRVGYTVGSLAFGSAMIVWSLFAGLAWPRAGRRGTGGKCNSPG